MHTHAQPTEESRSRRLLPALYVHACVCRQRTVVIPAALVEREHGLGTARYSCTAPVLLLVGRGRLFAVQCGTVQYSNSAVYGVGEMDGEIVWGREHEDGLRGR